MRSVSKNSAATPTETISTTMVAPSHCRRRPIEETIAKTTKTAISTDADKHRAARAAHQRRRGAEDRSQRKEEAPARVRREEPGEREEAEPEPEIGEEDRTRIAGRALGPEDEALVEAHQHRREAAGEREPADERSVARIGEADEQHEGRDGESTAVKSNSTISSPASREVKAKATAIRTKAMGKSQSPGSPTRRRKARAAPDDDGAEERGAQRDIRARRPGDAGEDEERDEEDPDHGSARGDAERRC